MTSRRRLRDCIGQRSGPVEWMRLQEDAKEVIQTEVPATQ